VSNLALGNTDAILYPLSATRIGSNKNRILATEARIGTRFTYRLEETGGQVLVDGQVTLLLLSQARLDG
jgi:hypothetical protein